MNEPRFSLNLWVVGRRYGQCTCQCQSSVVAGKGPEGSVPEGVVMLRHIPSTVSSRLLSVKEVASRTINSSHWKPMLLRWYLICELEDDDFPAHPAELVTIRSLKKAFSKDRTVLRENTREFFYVRRSWEIDFWIFLVRGKHKYICVVLCLLNNTMFQFGKDLFGHIAWYVWSVTTPKPQAWDCGPANSLQDDKAKRRIPDWERFTFCEEGGKVWDRETSSETYDNPCKQMDSVCVLRSVQSTIIPCLACSTFPLVLTQKEKRSLVFVTDLKAKRLELSVSDGVRMIGQTRRVEANLFLGSELEVRSPWSKLRWYDDGMVVLPHTLKER